MSTQNTGIEVNVQRDWDFDVNLSGVVAPTGRNGNSVPSGYYKVTLTDLYVNGEKNPNRVIIKVQVSDGPFKGAIRTSGLNKPSSAEDKVRHYWRALAESSGYTAAQLDAGEIKLGLGTFQNRAAHIFYLNQEDSEDGRDAITFLAPAEWAQQAQAFEMNGGAAALRKKERAEAQPAATIKAASGSALGGNGASTPIMEAKSSTGTKGANAATRTAVLAALGVG